MPKTKIILSFLALIEAVGGALALNTKKGTLIIAYSTTPHNGFCTQIGLSFTVNTNPVSNPATVYVYSNTELCDVPYRYGLSS